MSRHLILAAGTLAVALSLAACKPAPAVDPTSTDDDVPATAAELAPPLTPSGPAVVVPMLSAGDVGLQLAAHVEQIEFFSEQRIHLFSVSSRGGPLKDHLYAAFIGSEDQPIFEIADTATFKVMSVQWQAIGLELTETKPGAAEGEMVESTRRVIISWTEDPDTGAATVKVAPAT